MRDALSGIFGVADTIETVTIDSPAWFKRWHAPLLKQTKAAIHANRDDTDDVPRVFDGVFAQLQEGVTSGASGPVAFKSLLKDFADNFDRAPRGASLETLQRFDHSGTPFCSYLRAFTVVVARTVEKGVPLVPSAETAIAIVRIITVQQYPMLVLNLFPPFLVTREKSCAPLASMRFAFSSLQRKASPAFDESTFAFVPQAPSSHAPSNVATSVTTAAIS